MKSNLRTRQILFSLNNVENSSLVKSSMLFALHFCD